MLKGIGMFIWQGRFCGPDRTGHNPVTAAVDLAKLLGLTHVLLKIGEGTSEYSQSYANMEAAVKAFHEAEIEVWGWHYIHCGVSFDAQKAPHYDNRVEASPENEGAWARAKVRVLGLDGYVIDAEKELKVLDQFTRAARFMTALGDPGVPVGLSSFRFPKLHQELPWEIFLKACDLHMPQVYWNEPHWWRPSFGAEAETRESVKQLLALKQLPVIPTGRAYIGDGHPNPQPAELTQFLATAQGLGCPGANFWAMDFLYSHAGGQDRMEAISQYAWTPKATQPAVTKWKVVSFNLRVRSGPGMDSPTVGWLWKRNLVNALRVEDYGWMGKWAEVAPGKWAAVSWQGRTYMVAA